LLSIEHEQQQPLQTHTNNQQQQQQKQKKHTMIDNKTKILQTFRTNVLTTHEFARFVRSDWNHS
jgi:hypothetical protein